MEKKIKHLEFIQNIITRLNQNSFQIKGMSITITSAILALSLSQEMRIYSFIIFFSVALFWILDAYYLSLEKAYRSFYSKVAQKSEEEIDFQLKLDKNMMKGKSSWYYTLLNNSIWPIYLAQFVMGVIGVFF